MEAPNSAVSHWHLSTEHLGLLPMPWTYTTVPTSGVLPESAASRHAQAMDIAIVPLSDAWSVREMQICVRSLEALPSFAQELVQMLVDDAQGRLALG